MKKEIISNVLEWAKATKEIMLADDADDFSDLRKRDKKTIFSTLLDATDDYDTDGDCDGAYLSVNVEDATITFIAHSESMFPSDMLNHLDNMNLLIFDDDAEMDELMGYLESLLDTELINLTPHAITVLDQNNNVMLTIPSSGIARAEQTRERIGDIGGIPISKTGYGKVIDLPNPKAGVAYIVSVLTAQAAPDRKDLYIVDDMVRDENGNIIGCRALAQI